MNKKVALMGVSPIIGNKGCGALTFGSLQIVSNAYPDAELYLIDDARITQPFTFNYKETTKIVNIIDVRISKNFLHDTNLFLLLLASFLQYLLPIKPIKSLLYCLIPNLKRFSNLDYVFSISGGDSFSDIYGIRRFLDVSLTQILIIFLRIPLILLPQTLGPFKSYFSKFITGYILSKSLVVFTRDHTSIEEMKVLYPNKTITNKLNFCYDVAFVLQPEKPDILPNIFADKNNIPLVGLNISGLLFAGGYTGKNQFELKVDYRHLIRKIIETMTCDLNVKLLLVPHVYGTGFESDTTISKTLYQDFFKKSFKNIFLVDQDYNPHEIKYIIGQCDFFIGSRMHACIAAISQSVPAISIAYSKKFTGVMETIGIEFLVADPQKDTEEEIISLVKNNYLKREEIKSYLHSKMPVIFNTVNNLLIDFTY